MRLHKIISNTKPEFVRIGKHELAKVRQEKSLSTFHGKEIDGFLVESETMIKAILMNDDLFLKPIFFKGKTKRQCDGEYFEHNFSRIENKIEILKQATEVYKNIPLPSEPDKRILVKIIRYLVSRQISILPINTRNSKIGYTFSLVEDMTIETDSTHIINHLSRFTTNNYFSIKTHDRVNTCYECQGSYLNFSECCTKCNSIDLKTEDLIHHFRCAYVGPQSDFVSDQKLICPKCDHQLKHIGIDYDKPSEIHTCRSCNHSSQETKMKAKCVDCCKENELDQLISFEINEYILTEKAQKLAIQSFGKSEFGTTSSKAIDSNLLNNVAFNLIKSHEARRQRVDNINTYNMIVTIHETLLTQLNTNLQTSLLEEFATIIKPYLRTNDLMTLDAQNNIHGLLIDYDEDANSKIVDILYFNLNKMLSDNGWTDDNVINVSSQIVNL